MGRKEQIRKEYQGRRASLEQEQVTEWSDKIVQRIMASPLFLQAKTVLFYYPLEKEADLLAAAQASLRMGKQVGFPKIEGDEILFYRIRSLEEFQEGKFHVMEPKSGELITDPAPLVFVPGLVFDRKKNRMGYGKGYYDRYGKRAANAMKVGVSYEMQLSDEVPVNAYDIPMDYMVTERGIW